MQIWLNGRWFSRDDARVSAFDAGLQHGVGLFETMAASHGQVFRLGEHLHRLATSARELGLTDGLRVAPLADAVESTVSRNGLSEARIRLTVTGGDLNLLQTAGGRADHSPSILIVAQPPTRYPAELFDRGVQATVADAKLNPFEPTTSHKTLWYWPRLAALQRAGTQGAGESLWFSVTNHLAGGCVSNAFLVNSGRLLTPIARGEEPSGALPSAVLPGITRAAIIELAEDAGMPVERRMLSIDDVLGADEIFLTNSSWGVLPVVAVEANAIGHGAPGPITRQLREAWLALVDRETSDGSPATTVGG